MAAATPIITENNLPAIHALEVRVDPLVVRAKDFQIADQDGYEKAADFLRDCKTMQKDIRETMDPAVKKAHEAHKAVTGIRSKLLDPIDQAEKVVKQKMGNWVDAQERAARIERQRIEAEARKLAEEQQLREAEELEARGMPEAAEEAISAPIILPAIKEAPKPIAEGTSSRKRYSAKVVSLDALVKAAAEGRIPAGLVIANQSVLDSMARSLGESFSIPGVELQAETIIAAKGR